MAKKEEKDSVMMSFTLPTDIKDTISKIAEIDDVSVSSLLRLWVVRGVRIWYEENQLVELIK